jgi:hypothetical protein
MVFLHAKEVGDIRLTNQPCKKSKICLVIPKGEAMAHLLLSASFAFDTLLLVNLRSWSLVF